MSLNLPIHHKLSTTSDQWQGSLLIQSCNNPIIQNYQSLGSEFQSSDETVPPKLNSHHWSRSWDSDSREHQGSGGSGLWFHSVKLSNAKLLEEEKDSLLLDELEAAAAVEDLFDDEGSDVRHSFLASKANVLIHFTRELNGQEKS
ncbi:uncharacterized protein RCO7_14782 [Rhynchosporium graminicola]|uniref:Uncharacterized protein n=1 Tax=Rhynchosporium graminicola TaxID=2792576 RepID=A0A1E1L2D3_9HELO|nr:uncharacterized protein RCO7_14782 [Rhynchosporium commune]